MKDKFDFEFDSKEIQHKKVVQNNCKLQLSSTDCYFDIAAMPKA